MAKSKLSFDNPLLSGNTDEKEPTEKRGVGRPRRDDIIRDGVQEGLTADYTRFSVICKVKSVKDLKDYAYTKRITIREATDEVIESFFEAYRNNPENEALLDHTKKGKQ